jgi:hypothetical protein
MKELKDQVVTSFGAGREAARKEFAQRPPWVIPVLVVVSILTGRISDALLARHTSFNAIERYGISIIVVTVAGYVFLNLLRMLAKVRRGSIES